jgi:predicted LPLAT superfamily acyltransferase
MLAATGGHADVIRLLLETGADIEAADANGVMALMMTSFRGYTEVVRRRAHGMAHAERMQHGGEGRNGMRACDIS